MGVTLARIARYWDCFQEIEDFDQPIKKIKKTQKLKKEKEKFDISLSNSVVQNEMDLEKLEKLKPVKAIKDSRFRTNTNKLKDIISEKEMEEKNQQSNVVLTFENDDDETEKVKNLRLKLQQIKNKRLEKLRSKQPKQHLLNVINQDTNSNNSEMDKDIIQLT